MTVGTETMPDFLKAFDNLEGPISLIARRTRVVAWIIDGVLNQPADECGYRRISDEFLDVLASTIWDAQEAAEAMEGQWRDTHADRCEAELEERALKSSRGRPA